MLFSSLCIDDIKSDHFRFNGACREGIFSLHSFHVKQLQCMIIDYIENAAMDHVVRRGREFSHLTYTISILFLQAYIKPAGSTI